MLTTDKIDVQIIAHCNYKPILVLLKKDFIMEEIVRESVLTVFKNGFDSLKKYIRS